MREHHIAVIPGDRIGQEVCTEEVFALQNASRRRLCAFL